MVVQKIKGKKNNKKPAQIKDFPGLFAFESLERNVDVELNIIDFIFDDAKKKSEEAISKAINGNLNNP